MEKITLELETVTPLFIAGADQRNIENEGLRAPSLRGLLRWWFRAIMGGMVPISDLKELESRIFGSTSKNSSVRIFSTTKSQPLEINVPSNLRYLWFSIHMQKRKNQRLQCYLPKTKFKITLSSHDKDDFKITLGCLWALIYLGGVGARMRRGAGSLKVNDVSGETPYEFIFSGSTINDAKKFIEENLVKIFQDFKNYAGKRYNLQTNPNFAVLSKNHAKISLIKKTSNTWEEILTNIGEEYQRYRRGKRLEHRYTFGLPIITYSGFKDLRQASPLFIGIMDLNGTYTARIVKFYTSIHRYFFSKITFLKQDLDGFDSNLDEIEIKIPEGDKND
jgi:CRISPR-associated protein Cmr1